MRQHAETARSARAILDLDTRTVGRLRELLLEERDALSTRDAERLGGAVQSKLECLKQLERNEADRRALLQRAGAGTDWSRLLGSLDPELGEGWASLRNSLREVAELTEVNEKIVNRSRHSTARLLAILRGRGDDANAVYDRSGRTQGHGDNRPITSA